jgi:hypothetical protein
MINDGVMKQWSQCVYLIGLGLIVANGCTTKSDEIEVIETSSFDLIQSRILTPTCATTGCHASEQDGSFRQHSLLLTAGNSYEYLINKLSQQPEARAEGMARVKPFNSSESLFYHKLNWEASHHSGKQFGSPMPLGGIPLSVGQIEFVRRWIEAGAPKTGSVVDTTLLNDTTPSYELTFEGLTPPAPGTGIQMKLDPFTVSPTFEREFFVRKMVGNTNEVFVNRIQIKMRPGSHHFLLYDFPDKNKLPLLNTIRDIRNTDGTQNYETFLSMQNHVFWAGTQTPTYDYTFPTGAALRIAPGASYDLNSHYVNKTSQPFNGEVYVNLLTIPKSEVKHVVNSLDLGNTQFVLPAGQKTKTTKSFTFDKAIKVLMLTSHTHKFGEKFVIKIKGGARNGEIVYENTDWEHPSIKNFPTPIFLSAGEGLVSEITYNNTTTRTIRFGLTSEDEMGIIFGYYYEE